MASLRVGRRDNEATVGREEGATGGQGGATGRTWGGVTEGRDCGRVQGGHRLVTAFFLLVGAVCFAHVQAVSNCGGRHTSVFA